MVALPWLPEQAARELCENHRERGLPLMKSSTEKRKAFVDAFQESLGEMGFFVKNSVFYKYSKANKYLLYVNVEIAGAGTLLRINIGWGSNFAPIKCQRKMIYGAYELDVLRYLERNDAKVRGDIGQFVLKNDLPMILPPSVVPN